MRAMATQAQATCIRRATGTREVTVLQGTGARILPSTRLLSVAGAAGELVAEAPGGRGAGAAGVAAVVAAGAAATGWTILSCWPSTRSKLAAMVAKAAAAVKGATAAMAGPAATAAQAAARWKSLCTADFR